jgi:flagellar motor switch protein FliM
MNDFLDPSQIEALFARASEGNLPMEAPPAGAKGGKRTRWLRTVDFTRPTKFSTDQERRLRRLLDGFCATSSQRVLGEHRLPLELEVIDVQQLTWANAFKLLPESSVFGTLDTAPHEGRMLLSAELPLMVTAVEGLLGGDASTGVKDRPLTDIDLILVRRLMRTLVESLWGIWFDLAELTVSLAEVADTHLTLEQILALAPGDLIRLDVPADHPVTLCADRTPVLEARGGRWGTRRAVQITGPAAVPE